MSTKLVYQALLLIIAGYYCEKSVHHYNGYSVLRLIPKTQSQLNYLRELEENVFELDFWRGPSSVNRAVDVMVPPQLNKTYDKIFNVKGIDKSVLIDDLEKQIDVERAVKPVQSNNSRGDIIPGYFDRYNRYENVSKFLNAIQTKYPSIASVDSVGKSYEERDLKLIRIGRNQSSNTKPVIFIEGGIHGREWISSATAQCFAQYLVQGHASKNKAIVSLLKKFDIYILPVLNPDGYEYSHTHKRMWQKTRRPAILTLGICQGTDPNRNFDFHWGAVRASLNPCSDSYRGMIPFSEPETNGLSKYVLSIKDRLKAYFALHSYGQRWVYPYGYTSTPPPNVKDLDRMAKVAVSSMARPYGSRYTVGSIAGLIYPVSGGSFDWVYGRAGVKYTYGIDLRDTGKNGYILPPEQIRPTCAETSRSLIAFARELAKEV